MSPLRLPWQERNSLRRNEIAHERVEVIQHLVVVEGRQPGEKCEGLLVLMLTLEPGSGTVC